MNPTPSFFLKKSHSYNTPFVDGTSISLPLTLAVAILMAQAKALKALSAR